MKAKRVLSLLAFCPAAVFIGSSAAAGEELRDSPLRTTLPADRVVLPLELRDVQPVVEARVNGQGPFRFLVDTGAAGCGRISAELADELKLEEVGEIIASDPSGRNTMAVKKVGIDAVALGGAAAKAGLRKGDRITHINGETPGELGPARMREVFGSPKPIRITVEREGGRLELVVTPARQERDG